MAGGLAAAGPFCLGAAAAFMGAVAATTPMTQHKKVFSLLFVHKKKPSFFALARQVAGWTSCGGRPLPSAAPRRRRSESFRSMARQASSITVARNPNFCASSADQATQKSVARPAKIDFRDAARGEKAVQPGAGDPVGLEERGIAVDMALQPFAQDHRWRAECRGPDAARPLGSPSRNASARAFGRRRASARSRTVPRRDGWRRRRCGRPGASPGSAPRS